MRKLISLILAVTMFLTIVPAFAETTAETTEPAPEEKKESVADKLSGLFGSSSEGEGGGVTDLLGGLFGGSGEGGTDMSGLLGGLMGGETGSDLSGIVNGLKDKVNSLKETLSGKAFDKLPGKLSALVGILKDVLVSQLNKVGGQKVFSNILNSLLSKFSAGSSEGEGSGVGGFLTGMLGGSLDDVSDDDWAKWAEEYRNSPEYQEEMARKAAMEAYVLKEFADGLEAGDAQVVCLGAGIDDVQEDGSWKYLRNFSLTNYTADGKNLKMKNYANNVELLYVTKQEDGSYQVEVVMQAEEGEKYEASIVAMAEKYGEELDTVKINLGRKESAEVYNLANYLREHPEYEKGEFQGEYKTPDELDEIFLDLLGQELADVDFSF